MDVCRGGVLERKVAQDRNLGCMAGEAWMDLWINLLDGCVVQRCEKIDSCVVSCMDGCVFGRAWMGEVYLRE